MSKTQHDPIALLIQADSLLRSAPPLSSLHHPTEDNIAWLGQASQVIEAWDPFKVADLAVAMERMNNATPREAITGTKRVLMLLHQAKSDLQMRTNGPLNVAIGEGLVFDYFDEIRKIIETASNELFFIDPYINAEFVSRYLSLAKEGVNIRLLTSQKELDQLLSAIEMFSKQHKNSIEVRHSSSLHDCPVFVDRIYCYQSGASFKDGGKKGTIIGQIVDAFDKILNFYDDKWNEATVAK